MSPLARSRQRYLAARQLVGRANRSGDRSLMSRAMRLLNQARADYQRTAQHAAGWIAYSRAARATNSPRRKPCK